jgi:nitrogen fixation/metabolism regulation signal transduction histidine kinase
VAGCQNHWIVFYDNEDEIMPQYQSMVQRAEQARQADEMRRRAEEERRRFDEMILTEDPVISAFYGLRNNRTVYNRR